MSLRARPSLGAAGEASDLWARPMSLMPRQQDHDSGRGLAAHVGRKPRYGAHATAAQVVKDSVAADTLVDDAERLALHRAEAAGEKVGPSLVGVHGRPEAVGDRIPESDHGAVIPR